MVKISAVVITKNEESNILQCLQSMDGVVDEIVVVDAFSTDKTKEICLANGVRFFERTWSGYGDQKNWGAAQASNTYILSLDADEHLSLEMRKSILNVKNNWTHDAYTFSRLNVYCGKPIRFSGWYPDRKLRLWDKTKGEWDSSEVHELVQMQKNAKILHLKGDIIHCSYLSISEHIIRVSKYSDLWVEKAVRCRKKTSLLRLFCICPWHFSVRYFIDRGFLDGFYGLIISIIIAYESLLKYAKLYQYQKMRKGIVVKAKSPAVNANTQSATPLFNIHISTSNPSTLSTCLRSLEKNSCYQHQIILEETTKDNTSESLINDVSYDLFVDDKIFVVKNWDHLLWQEIKHRNHSSLEQTGVNVVFDCERMKYPYSGLFEYCRLLGNALSNNVKNSKISYYVPSKYKNYFGTDKDYIEQKKIHKLFFPYMRSVNVWHMAHQETPYAPRLKKIKKVLTVHDLNFLYEKRSAFKAQKRLRRVQKNINWCDHIVAISEYTKQDILTHMDVGNKPITVIYNGCKVEEYPGYDTPTYRPEKPFLFSIGVILPKKNFHVLPSLLKENDYDLIIAGRGDQSYKQKILQEAKKYGVANRVKLIGPISEKDKYWYFANCHAFMFPSIAEGFGIPVIEAMHFGKPTFLSTATSLPEIGGEYAYYFENFEPLAMKEVFEKGMEHYAQVNPAAQIKEYAKRFDWEESAKKYWEVYENLRQNTDE